MGAAHQPFCPSTERRVALSHIGQRRARSMDQLSAEVFVAAFADPEQLRPAAGSELTGNQAEPRGEIAPTVEAFRLTNGGDKGRSDDRADARDCHQPTSLLVVPHPADELGVESRDPPVEFGPLRASVGDQKGHPWAQSFTALFVHEYGQELLKLPLALRRDHSTFQ